MSADAMSLDHTEHVQGPARPAESDAVLLQAAKRTAYNLARVAAGANLGVVARLESLYGISLPCLLCACNEAVQALVDDGEIGMKLPLSWDNVARDGNIPVGYVEG
jgi:hypothetical protein